MGPLVSLPLQGLARYLPLLGGGAAAASQTDPKGLEYLKEGLSSLINPASYSLNPLEDILESKIEDDNKLINIPKEEKIPEKDPNEGPEIPPSGIGEALDLIKEREERRKSMYEDALQSTVGDPNVNYRETDKKRGQFVLDAPYANNFWSTGPYSFPGGSINPSKSLITYMKPGDFLKLSANKDFSEKAIEERDDRAFELYEKNKTGLTVPVLDMTEDAVSGDFEVIGHEGRSRAKYFENLDPNKLIPVQIQTDFVNTPSGKSRNPEYIDYTKGSYTHGQSIVNLGEKLMKTNLFKNQDGDYVSGIEVLGYEGDGKKVEPKSEETLKPNENFFYKISGSKNSEIVRDPNDLFEKGWENKMFPTPKGLGVLGDYDIGIDVMKRTDNNFLLFKDGKVHATLELATPKGQDNVIELDAIGVPENMQGKGIATDVLNQLFKLADENGVTIMGSAQAFGNKAMNKKELTKFYNKMGFEGTADNLVRKPKKTTENPLEDILESQIQNKEKETYFGTEEAIESFYDASNNIDVMFDIKELNKPENQKYEYGQNIPAHEFYENQYHGGVGDLGNADAFKKLKKLSYYPEYKKLIQESAKEHLGESFPAYRLVRGDMEAYREGKPSLEKDINSYSLNPEDALSLHNMIDYSEGLGKNRNNLVLQEVYINAKDLVMRGKEAENEIVVNTKKLDTDTVRVFDPFTGKIIKDATKGQLVGKELFKFNDKTRLGGKKDELSNDDDFIKF
jgi:predicted GNAT family acetyltransferase